MGNADVKKVRRAQAAGIARGIVRPSVATHRVGAGREAVGSGRPAGGSSDGAPLGVVEYVERLRSKLKIHTFLDREVFVQSHAEIVVTGVAQGISAGIPEGQSLRGGECPRIGVQWTVTSERHIGYAGRRIANQVGIRACSHHVVSDSGIVTVVGGVGWSVWGSRQGGHDAGILPS